MGQNNQEPLARPLIRSLAPLTHSLAPDCSLRSRPPLRSLVRSLAHFAHSLARGTVNDWMAILSVFFPIFDQHSKTSTLADCQKASVVRTLYDLFFLDATTHLYPSIHPSVFRSV